MHCCQTTSFAAWACYSRHVLGREFIPVHAQGNATIFIDTWSVNVTSTAHMDVFYTDDILDFKVVQVTAQGPEPALGWDCDRIQFPPHA